MLPRIDVDGVLTVLRGKSALCSIMVARLSEKESLLAPLRDEAWSSVEGMKAR